MGLLLTYHDKDLWMILLLIEEAQHILEPRNHREYLDHYIPEHVPSEVSSCTRKKRLLCSKIFWKHKIKQKETDVFIAAFLEPFTGTLALSFSKVPGFQTYFTMKSLHMKYLMRLNFSGTFFGKCR